MTRSNSQRQTNFGSKDHPKLSKSKSGKIASVSTYLITYINHRRFHVSLGTKIKIFETKSDIKVRIT